jgi:hypothetical protein
MVEKDAGWSAQRIRTAVNLGFLDRNRYFPIQIASQKSSRGWVDPVLYPPLVRKSGSAGNRTRYLWTCSQELWPVTILVHYNWTLYTLGDVSADSLRSTGSRKPEAGSKWAGSLTTDTDPCQQRHIYSFLSPPHNIAHYESHYLYKSVFLNLIEDYLIGTCGICSPVLLFPAPCSLLPAPCSLFPVPCFLFPVSCFLFPVSCFLFPVSCSLFPVPCSLFPVSCSLFPVPCSLFPIVYLMANIKRLYTS